MIKNKLTLFGCLVLAALLALTVNCKKEESAKTLDEAEFQDYVFNYIKTKFPDSKISKSDEKLIIKMDNGKLGLANIYKKYLNESAGKEKLDMLLDTHFQILMKNKQEADKIGKLTWKEAKKFIRPQFIPEGYKKLNLVNKPFDGVISIGFVIDLDHRYSFINRAKLEEWQKDIETLNQVALDNLYELTKNIKPEIKEFPQIKYVGYNTRDGYDAVRILLPQLRKTVLKELGGACNAAIPVRDFLIFWSKNSSEAFKKYMIDKTNTIYTSEPYPLTKKIYQVTADQIKENKSYNLDRLKEK